MVQSNIKYNSKYKKFYQIYILSLFLLQPSFSAYVILPFKVVNPDKNVNSLLEYFTSITQSVVSSTVTLGKDKENKINFYISLNEGLSYIGKGMCKNNANSYYRNDKCLQQYNSYLQMTSTCLIEETFYFYKDISISKENIKSEIKLLFGYENLNKINSTNYCGSLGFSLSEIGGFEDLSNFSNFINQLKKNGLIKKLIFSYHFFDDTTRNIFATTYNPSYRSYDGYFAIGELPESYLGGSSLSSAYKSNHYVKTNAGNKGKYIIWELIFNKITIAGTYPQIDYELKNQKGVFDESISYIISSINFFDNIKTMYFNYFLSHKICFEEQFVKDEMELFNGIYCDKSQFEKEIETFPQISFYNLELDFMFNFTNNELFEIKGNKIYFKIIHDYSIDSWRLGQLFLKKYHMIFNYEEKTIGIYKENIPKKLSKGTSFIVHLIYIVLAVLVGLGGLFIGYRLWKRRGRKVNELDNYYDYEVFGEKIGSKKKEGVELYI